MTPYEKKLRAENERLREALKLFTMAFDRHKDKLTKKWSIGYWEGYEPGLVIANGGEAEFLKDTRFCAAMQYDASHILTALNAVKER
jgi:hypothetical protein